MNPIRADLSFTEFEQLLGGAFLPYQCTFKSIDHGSGFSFSIFDGDTGVLQVTHGNQRRITDRRARSVISQTRRYLREHGHKLSPWRFPERA